MLDTLYLQILDMNRVASIVILVVMVARLFLKKSPKWISYALWAVVLVRLLCPVSWETAVSIVPEVSSVAEEYTLADEPISFAGAGVAVYHAVGDAINGGLGVQQIPTTEIEEETGTVRYVTTDWWSVWILFGKYIWVIGMVGMTLYSVIAYGTLRRKLQISVSLRDNIFIADDILSPFVIGFLKPRIYLPCGLEEQEQSYIILHEQYHIRRFDHVIKGLAFFALTLHCFNPLVWVAFVLACRDMEMSCDEAVIHQLGEDIRAEYATSLLKLATGRRIIAGTPLAFGEGDTRGRIKNIANWRKPTFWVVLVAVTACIALAVCLLTDPVGEIGNEVQEEFVGKVNNIGETGYIVTVMDSGSSDLAVGDRVLVYTELEENPECSVGDYVKVYFNGVVVRTLAVSLADASISVVFDVERLALDPADTQEEQTCIVDGQETDYAVIAQKLTEQYVNIILARPAWYPQTALDVVPIGAEVFDAYYGEDKPNFCFALALYVKISEEQRMDWEVGSGLGEALDSGDYAGYYYWGREAYVEKDEHGNWYLEGLNTGGTSVRLPVVPEEASVQQLIEMYFLTEGFTHDYRLLYYLAERQVDEVTAQLEKLEEERKEKLTDALLVFIEEYPDYANDQWKQWSKMPCQNEETTSGTPLSQEELLFFESLFANEEGRVFTTMLLSSEYDAPENIHLGWLFREGVPNETGDWGYSISAEEMAALQKVLDEESYTAFLRFDVSKTPRLVMEELLMTWLGVSLADTQQIGMDFLVYLEEYDAYYSVASDTASVIPSFSSGIRRADGAVELRYHRKIVYGGVDHSGPDTHILTLRPMGDSYQFVSNLRIEK